MRKSISLSLVGLALAFSANAQLSGVKSINPNGSGADNYTSFGAAITALQSGGVSGAITFNVAPGVYQEKITINAAATLNAAADKPVIFQKDPSLTGTVSLRPNTADAGTPVVSIVDASWLIIDGIDVEDGGNQNGVGVTNRGFQLSGAQHCTLKNFTIRMNSRGLKLNEGSRGIASATPFGGSRPLRYNTFDNLRIVHVGNRAFSLFADFGLREDDENDKGNKVVNCTIDSIGSGTSGESCLGAFFLKQDSLVFSNNKVTNISHTPTGAFTLTVIQISSNPDDVDETQGIVVENNVIGNANSFSDKDTDLLTLARINGGVVRNNTVKRVEAPDMIGVFTFQCSNLLFENNTIDSVLSFTTTARGIIAGQDGLNNMYKNNTFSNISSASPDGGEDVVGIEVQVAKGASFVGNKVYNIYANEFSEGPTATGARISAAISSDDLPDGGNVYFYNNFISNVYQQNASLVGDGQNRAVGFSSINFADAAGATSTGGTQHIYNNTILVNSPNTTPTLHGAIGAIVFGSADDDNDNVFFKNNIVVNRNVSEEGGDSSFVVQIGQNATVLELTGNNYEGAVGSTMFFGSDDDFVYNSLSEWMASGNETGADSVVVTFANEATGDLHLSEANYTNIRLRKYRVSMVSTDIDGTARANSDSQVGADAQVNEQNLLPVSVKGNLAKAKSLSVYPNPTRETARFAMNVEKSTSAQIVVRNLMGQAVATKNVTLNAGANEAGINVANLSAGIYVYSVTVDGKVATGKFIKE